MNFAERVLEAQTLHKSNYLTGRELQDNPTIATHLLELKGQWIYIRGLEKTYDDNDDVRYISFYVCRGLDTII